MVSVDSLLAAVLLTAPAGTHDVAGLQQLHPALAGKLQTLAIRWEILDPREVRYILARPEDFASDLSLLRRRYHDLAHAPNVADGQRFPERWLINETLAFNRAYRQQVEGRRQYELVHCGDLHESVQEADRLYQIWDAVRDARCDYYYVTVRRQALNRLRSLIGEDMYYKAELPPAVPLWRFLLVQ